jgi:hypothetical protein
VPAQVGVKIDGTRYPGAPVRLQASIPWGKYLGSIYGKAVLYFLARPPIRAFRLGETRVTGCTDTF